MRVAIILAAQNGDVAASTAVFKYRTKLWGPNPEIHWYVMGKFKQSLEHNPHVIIHERESVDYMKATEDMSVEAIQEHYDRLYRPAPYLYGELALKAPILLIPVAVFGFKRNVSWRPQIYLTQEEIAQARKLMDTAPRKKRVLFETYCNSHQSDWDDKLTCELGEKLKDCVLVVPSHADHLRDLGLQNVFDLRTLNYRQLAEAYNHCDYYVGCSSGGAVVTTASRCIRNPRAEYMMKGKEGWSTKCVTGAAVFTDRAKFVAYCVHMVGNGKAANRDHELKRVRHEARRLAVKGGSRGKAV